MITLDRMALNIAVNAVIVWIFVLVLSEVSVTEARFIAEYRTDNPRTKETFHNKIANRSPNYFLLHEERAKMFLSHNGRRRRDNPSTSSAAQERTPELECFRETGCTIKEVQDHMQDADATWTFIENFKCRFIKCRNDCSIPRETDVTINIKDLEETCNNNVTYIPAEAVNGSFGGWFYHIHDCPEQCENQTFPVYRRCNDPPPSRGGVDCDISGGKRKGKENCIYCKHDGAAVAGNWGEWESWNDCSVTCGNGSTTRKRGCNNPRPLNDGAYCIGEKKEITTCLEIPCQINGGWSSWNPWSNCNVSCGAGMQSRTRSCNSPEIPDIGLECTGYANEEIPCNEHPCPVDGEWSSWNQWSNCTVTCGGGLQTRTRSCNNPEPHYDGLECNGSITEETACNENQCPDYSKHNVCCCAGQELQWNITLDELEVIVQTLKKELAVDKKQTSMAKRTKISAGDSRKSSKVIGLFGIFIIAVPVVFVVGIDLMNVFMVT